MVIEKHNVLKNSENENLFGFNFIENNFDKAIEKVFNEMTKIKINLETKFSSSDKGRELHLGFRPENLIRH